MLITRALFTVGATALGCLLTASSLTVATAATGSLGGATAGSLGTDAPAGSLGALGSLGAGARDFDPRHTAAAWGFMSRVPRRPSRLHSNWV